MSPFRLALSAAILAGIMTGSALAGPKAPARITGLWLLTPEEYDRDETIPFTFKGAELNEKRRKAVEEDGQVISATNKKCLPVGMPVFMTNEFALEIAEVPGRIIMLSENSSVPRSIYLNRADHKTDADAGWNGHSIGHWEGKTLVVDTVGFNDRLGPIFRSGVHSPTTHLVEKFHLKDPDTLVGMMTFEDPTYLAKPWTSTHSYKRMPANAELWEYACEPDADGWSERFKGDPQAKASPPK